MCNTQINTNRYSICLFGCEPSLPLLTHPRVCSESSLTKMQNKGGAQILHPISHITEDPRVVRFARIINRWLQHRKMMSGVILPKGTLAFVCNISKNTIHLYD